MESASDKGNCFLHHITAPDLTGKDETVLKKNFQNMCSGYFFPEQNFILRIFLSEIDFLFFFWIFISETQLFLFWIFFFGMHYFSIPDFFVRNRILILVSGFLFPKLNNYFWIYFSGIYYFQFRIFISRIKGIFGN